MKYRMYTDIENNMKHIQNLDFASQETCNDRETVLNAVKYNGCWLQCASINLQKDREIVSIAVRQNWRVLKIARLEFKKDRDIVFSAVQQNGAALQYAHEECRADFDIVLLAVKNCGRVLGLASEDLRSNRDIVLAAVQHDGCAIQHAAIHLQFDRDIALCAVNNKGDALLYIPQKLRNDMDVALCAVRQNPKCAIPARYVPAEITNNIKFTSAVKSNIAISGTPGIVCNVIEIIKNTNSDTSLDVIKNSYLRFFKYKIINKIFEYDIWNVTRCRILNKEQNTWFACTVTIGLDGYTIKKNVSIYATIGDFANILNEEIKIKNQKSSSLNYLSLTKYIHIVFPDNTTPEPFDCLITLDNFINKKNKTDNVFPTLLFLKFYYRKALSFCNKIKTLIILALSYLTAGLHTFYCFILLCLILLKIHLTKTYNKYMQ